MSFCTALISSAAESISVSATPRYPWNGNVDVKFTITGESGVKYDTSFTAKDVAGGTNLTMKTLYKSNGAAANPAKEQLLPGNYSWVWDAQADLGADTVLERVTVTAETVAPDLGGVQLWENGPYWAECNVGATKPEEYGYYFWWGDTVGYTRSGGTWTNDYYYSDVTWVSSTGTRMSNSPFSSSSCTTCNKNTSTLQAQGYIDSTGNLVAKYDAATAHLGAPWRMPTDAEFSALFNICTTTWTTRNGVYGWLVTGKGAYASKSIFFPAAGCCGGSNLSDPGSIGYYWSSTPSTPFGAYSDFAQSLLFNSGGLYPVGGGRTNGQSVRPLRGFAR